MIERRGKIDVNDLKYVVERHGEPLVVSPAPISIYKVGEHNGKQKINPHVSRFLVGEKIVDVFHVKPIYYLHINGEWRPMSEIACGFGNHWIDLKADWDTKCDLRYLRWLLKRMEIINGNVKIPSPIELGVKVGLSLMPEEKFAQILFTVSTFYPDPNVETTSVDGYVSKDNSSSWATTRAAADGQSAGDSGVDWIVYNGFESPNYRLRRGFALFDTSSIPDTDTIDSAIISVYQTNQSEPAPNTDSNPFYWVSSTPASNTALVIGDFDQIGSTSFGNFTHPGTFDQYYDTTLNASGLANISATGISKFALRPDFDFNNSTPTQVAQGIRIDSAETAGTTKDPKLAVTHTGATSANVKRRMLMGIG